MITVKVGRNGQVVIPSVVRKRLGLEEGDRVAFVVDGDGKTVLEPVKKTLRELRGSVKVKRRDIEKVRLEVRQKNVDATEASLKGSKARSKRKGKA
jgi:AbrB family looped-hinge helix DNA binding protein